MTFAIERSKIVMCACAVAATGLIRLHCSDPKKNSVPFTFISYYGSFFAAMQALKTWTIDKEPFQRLQLSPKRIKIGFSAASVAISWIWLSFYFDSTILRKHSFAANLLALSNGYLVYSSIQHTGYITTSPQTKVVVPRDKKFAECLYYHMKRASNLIAGITHGCPVKLHCIDEMRSVLHQGETVSLAIYLLLQESNLHHELVLECQADTLSLVITEEEDIQNLLIPLSAVKKKLLNLTPVAHDLLTLLLTGEELETIQKKADAKLLVLAPAAQKLLTQFLKDKKNKIQTPLEQLKGEIGGCWVEIDRKIINGYAMDPGVMPDWKTLYSFESFGSLDCAVCKPGTCGSLDETAPHNT